jgi:hypothetical protein
LTITERANLEVARAKKLVEQARARIPAEFHEFIRELDQNVRIHHIRYEITDDLKALGVWSSERGTYVTVKVPYLVVDGRVAMMEKAHAGNGAQYSLSVEPEQVGDQTVMRCTFEGLSASGAPCKTVGRAKIGFGEKSGVDATNPVENAESSSVGRALAFAGYGLIGTGIASADELPATRETGREKEQDGPQDEHAKYERAKREDRRLIATYLLAAGMDARSSAVKDAICRVLRITSTDQIAGRHAEEILKNPAKFVEDVRRELSARKEKTA